MVDGSAKTVKALRAALAEDVGVKVVRLTKKKFQNSD